MKPKNIGALTWLIFQLNHLIDSGKYHISIDQAHSWAESENIIGSLKSLAGDDIDLSVYRPGDGPYSHFVDSYHECAGRTSNAYTGNDFGIHNNGLCLLLAWTNEMIQNYELLFPED